jgi:hypothetical protein
MGQKTDISSDHEFTDACSSAEKQSKILERLDNTNGKSGYRTGIRSFSPIPLQSFEALQCSDSLQRCIYTDRAP